jgi:CBS domain-containing protein
MPRVEQIMKNNITTVTPAAPIVEVAQKMKDYGQSTIPVCENGKLRGIITESTIVSRIVASAQNPKREYARSLMTNGIPKVSLGCDIVEAAKIMAKNRVHYLPVVQNGGKLMGILTLDDLAKENIALASMVLARTDEKHSTNGSRNE